MKYTGKDGFIKLGEDKLAFLDAWSLSMAADTAEVNELGTRGKKVIGTAVSGSGSISGTLDFSDPGQSAIVDMFFSGGEFADVDLHLVLAEGAVSNEEFTGPAFISGFDTGVAHADKATFSANFQFQGEPVHNTKADE